METYETRDLDKAAYLYCTANPLFPARPPDWLEPRRDEQGQLWFRFSDYLLREDQCSELRIGCAPLHLKSYSQSRALLRRMIYSK